MLPLLGQDTTCSGAHAERMSSSAYDLLGSDAQHPRPKRPASASAAPNNAGVMLLAVALLMVVALTAFVGAPAFFEMREQTSCVAVAGESMSADTTCDR